MAKLAGFNENLLSKIALLNTFHQNWRRTILNATLMDDYISKPIDENLLYSKIVELVKKKQ